MLNQEERRKLGISVNCQSVHNDVPLWIAIPANDYNYTSEIKVEFRCMQTRLDTPMFRREMDLWPQLRVCTKTWWFVKDILDNNNIWHNLWVHSIASLITVCQHTWRVAYVRCQFCWLRIWEVNLFPFWSLSTLRRFLGGLAVRWEAHRYVTRTRIREQNYWILFFSWYVFSPKKTKHLYFAGTCILNFVWSFFCINWAPGPCESFQNAGVCWCLGTLARALASTDATGYPLQRQTDESSWFLPKFRCCLNHRWKCAKVWCQHLYNLLTTHSTHYPRCFH